MSHKSPYFAHRVNPVLAKMRSLQKSNSVFFTFYTVQVQKFLKISKLLT